MYPVPSVSTGVLFAIPVAQTDTFTAAIGIQPGFSYEVKRDSGNQFELGGLVGAQARYTPSEELAIAARLGYSYGLNASVTIDWIF